MFCRGHTTNIHGVANQPHQIDPLAATLLDKLSESTRAAIIYAVEKDQKPAQIARDFEIDRTTVYKTLNRWKNDKTLVYLPRKGSPRKLTYACSSVSYNLVERVN